MAQSRYFEERPWRRGFTGSLLGLMSGCRFKVCTERKIFMEQRIEHVGTPSSGCWLIKHSEFIFLGLSDDVTR